MEGVIPLRSLKEFFSHRFKFPYDLLNEKSLIHKNLVGRKTSTKEVHCKNK